MAGAAGGALEELDGTPIGGVASAASSRRIPWSRAVAAATAAVAGRPRLWAYALVAFLARGGIVALAAPMIVLPTLIGIANFVGVTSVTASGPTPRLVALGVVAAVVAGMLAVSGTLVAAAAETALHRETAHGRGEAPPRRAVARVAAIRLVLLVPVVAAAALALPAWAAVAYRELTLPSDVATPLVLRILSGAPISSCLVAISWLACEMVGGFAARRAVLLGAPVPRALGAGLLDSVRRPGRTALDAAAAIGVSVALLVPAAWAIAAAWDAARPALVDGAGVLPMVAGALLLAAAFGAGLVVSAGAAAWRAALVTEDLLGRGA